MFQMERSNLIAIAVLLGLLALVFADKPSSSGGSYGAPQTPQIKYGGPIVYSGEKPPIIHFPPPPQTVSLEIRTVRSLNRIKLSNCFLHAYLNL